MKPGPQYAFLYHAPPAGGVEMWVVPGAGAGPGEETPGLEGVWVSPGVRPEQVGVLSWVGLSAHARNAASICNFFQKLGPEIQYLEQIFRL